MTKLKINDRVKVKCEVPNLKLPKGSIGQIVFHSAKHEELFLVHFDQIRGEETTEYINTKFLEKIKPDEQKEA